jgi:hypothetical protein
LILRDAKLLLEWIPSPTISVVLMLRDCAPHNPVDITTR